MTKAVQRRRGTASEHQTFTGLEGEITVNTTNDSVHVHDGSTAGGFELARADGSNVDGFSITGNLGIGTSDPKERFEIAGRDSNIRIYGRSGISDNSISSNLYFDSTWTRDDVTSGAVAIELDTRTDNALKFYTTAATSGYPSEAARIDSSGNLLVGTTTTTGFGSTTGAQLRSNGGVFATVSGDQALALSRTSSDGNIAEFYKDGTTVGSIGSDAGVTIYMDGGGARAGIYMSGSGVLPRYNGALADNATDLGTSSRRFKDLYLSGGVYLGGTGSANLLDDYEEGTWTPVLVGLTTAGDYTVTSTNATYTKVGQVVHVAARMTITVNSAGTGLAKFGGLPFTSAGASVGVGPVRTKNISFPASSAYATIILFTSNTTDFSLSYTKNNANVETLDVSSITSTDFIEFSMTYQTT